MDPENKLTQMGDLFAALAKFQSECPEIAKTKTVNTPKFQYKYADLSNIWLCIRKHLGKHGLCVIQLVQRGEAGHGEHLETVLGHSSGGSISSTYKLGNTTTPQARGSELTYARRYSLCAILGIAADEDEDGHIAEADSKAAPRKKAPAKPTKPAPPPKEDAPFGSDPLASTAQSRRLHVLGNGIVGQDLSHDFIRFLYTKFFCDGIPTESISTSDMTGRQAKRLLEFLEHEKFTEKLKSAVEQFDVAQQLVEGKS